MYTWLTCTEASKGKKLGMLCKVCLASKKKNPFTTEEGCTNYRTSTLDRHVKITDHKLALSDSVLRKNFVKASQTAIAAKSDAVITAMRSVYWLAKESIATAKYPSLMEFLRLQGCESLSNLDIGKNATYSSRATADEFQEIIASIVEKDLIEKIKASKFVSILMDESTDISVTKKMVVYIRFMNSVESQSWLPETHFLGNISIEDPKSTADILFKFLTDFLVSKGIPLSKVLGFGSDGASVMVGKQNGVATKVKEYSPHCINIHCVAHRLNLCTSQASQDIPYLKDTFEKTFTDLFYYFHQSSKRAGELTEIQKILNSPELKIKEVHEIRWLAFYDALNTVFRSWPALVKYFDAHKNDSKATRSLHEKLTDYRFLACCHMMKDIIGPLSQLCLIFQKQNLDLAAIQPAVKQVLSTLKEAKKGKSYYQREFVETMCALKNSKGETVKGKAKFGKHVLVCKESIKLSNKEFEEVRGKFVEALERQICRRFPTESVGVAEAFDILGLRALSHLIDEDAIESYGNEQLKVLTNHYGIDKTSKKEGVQSSALVDVDHLQMEFKFLKKLVVKEKYPLGNTSNLWALIKLHHNGLFPNILTLAEIGLLLPYHTSDCERGFSLQNNIKTCHRNRLGAAVLNRLMLLVIEGPSIENFNFGQALGVYKSGKSRRLFHP